MEDFIGSAPPTQILFLMSVPCVGAMLLGLFIFFSVNRRSKKSEMKLGIPPKKEGNSTADSSMPSTFSPKKQLASPAMQTAPELNLDVIGKNTETEVESIGLENDQEIDLAARLQNFSAFPEDDSTLSPHQNELLRLLRHPQSEQLIVEIAGRQYTKLADVPDKALGQYILELTAHLLAFTNGMIVTKSGIKSFPAPQTGIVPKPIKSRHSAVPSPPVSQTKSVPSPPAPPEVENTLLSSLRKNLSEDDSKPQKSGFFSVVNPAPQPASLPSLNLADEINDIVQDRLRSSPLEQHHQISIVSDPGGGIRIRVNQHSYSSPDEIPDAAVRNLIKSSIKEWERR
ncbi:MAG: hypothetical protein KDJ65_23305 [Anaerolineae bacterium]|nr:hypothetical protein [Anaerolineae bacterium]